MKKDAGKNRVIKSLLAKWAFFIAVFAATYYVGHNILNHMKTIEGLPSIVEYNGKFVILSFPAEPRIFRSSGETKVALIGSVWPADNYICASNSSGSETISCRIVGNRALHRFLKNKKVKCYDLKKVPSQLPFELAGDCRTEKDDIGYTLVSNGFAYPLGAYKNNENYKKALQSACTNKRGMWSIFTENCVAEDYSKFYID